MEGISLLRRALAELEAGRSVAEAVVLSTAGSAARASGARMVLLEDGSFLGTVGGGSPELESQKLCRDVLSGKPALRMNFKRGVVDIACGGSQLIGIRRLSSADAPALRAALESADAGSPVELAVDWSASAPVAAVGAPAGAGASPRMEGDLYLEPVVCAPRCVIFGGGHVGRALVPALAAIDFDVVVVDDRPEVAVSEKFPDASSVILGDFKDISASVTLGHRDYVVVMTHGHAADEDVVAQAVAAHPLYLGCMGSRNKRRVLEGVLASRGVSADEVATVDLPIGLSIGAVTPAEIAVSIAAKMIEVRSGHCSSREKGCPSHL